MKKLERRSGASISVRGNKGAETRKVVITGTEENVEVAKQELDKLLHGPPSMKLSEDDVRMITGDGGKMLGDLQQRSGAQIHLRGSRGDPEAILRRFVGDPEAAQRRHRGGPEATWRRPRGDPEVIRRVPRGDPEAIQR